jgi:multicomponent Na+:H+ antiporter subunit D
MAGIGHRMPVTMTAFAVGTLSLASIPLFAGFVSKWHLLLGSAAAEAYLILALFVVSGGLNVAYFWPIVYTAFFETPDDADPKPVVEGSLGGRGADGDAAREARIDDGSGGDARVDGGEAESDRTRARPSLGRETSPALLVPIVATAALVVGFGVGADWLFFLDAATMIAENAGVSEP